MKGIFEGATKAAEVTAQDAGKVSIPQTEKPHPSLGEMKDRLQDIFKPDSSEKDIMGTIDPSEQKPLLEETPKAVTLDDGTVVKIPRPEPPVSHLEKTDDNGAIYLKDGSLEANSQYELNGNAYTTDDQGRIVTCEAKPQHSPENPRDVAAQLAAGGEDRRLGDQGGHIVARDLNGDGGAGNLVAMDSRINQSDYKRMEGDVKSALNSNQDVTTKTEMTYSGDSKRPDTIQTTVTADGVDTVYKFDNNMDGSLMKDVPENGKDIVSQKIEDTNGEISSIKFIFNENGELIRANVNITYKGEDGTNYRTQTVIDCV